LILILKDVGELNKKNGKKIGKKQENGNSREGGKNTRIAD
jgi:hypothetical protein